MEIKKRKEVLGSIETSFSSSGQPCTFPVRFNTPVQVSNWNLVKCFFFFGGYNIYVASSVETQKF